MIDYTKLKSFIGVMFFSKGVFGFSQIYFLNISSESDYHFEMTALYTVTNMRLLIELGFFTSLVPRKIGTVTFLVIKKINIFSGLLIILSCEIIRFTQNSEISIYYILIILSVVLSSLNFHRILFLYNKKKFKDIQKTEMASNCLAATMAFGLTVFNIYGSFTLIALYEGIRFLLLKKPSKDLLEKNKKAFFFKYSLRIFHSTKLDLIIKLNFVARKYIEIFIISIYFEPYFVSSFAFWSLIIEASRAQFLGVLSKFMLPNFNSKLQPNLSMFSEYRYIGRLAIFPATFIYILFIHFHFNFNFNLEKNLISLIVSISIFSITLIFLWYGNLVEFLVANRESSKYSLMITLFHLVHTVLFFINAFYFRNEMLICIQLILFNVFYRSILNKKLFGNFL